MMGIDRIVILILMVFSHVGSTLAQVYPPGKPTDQRILLLNGKAHIGNGDTINKSAIAIENGKITMVKNALLITIKEADYDTIIDIAGQHVYPGFIAPNSTVGLQEIGSVRATKDYRETGSLNPHVRSAIAFNTDSRVTATVKTNGVLIGQICPRGGRISGTSSILHFDGWNWEDALYREDDAIHINWPAMFSFDWKTRGRVPNKKYNVLKNELEDFFMESSVYAEKKWEESNRFYAEKSPTDLRFEAMKEVFTGGKSVCVHADFVKEIQDIIEFKKQFNIERMILVGGYDSYLVAENLKNNDIAVVLRRLHSLPMYQQEDVDLPYKLPKLLKDAGVKFCLNNAGDMEQMGLRNLPFYAGTAVAYGLSYEDAVASITSSAAEILGIDDVVGTLEEGKDATLIVSRGDALDMMTNKLSLAMVQGRFMILRNHQDDLYQKYMNKYGLTD